MPAAHVTYLAQAASVFGWSIVVLIFIVLGFVAIAWVRKWLKEDDIPSGGTGFGLGELRKMHARGELTAEEYERARSKMSAAAKAITADMPDPAGGRRAPGIAMNPSPGANPTLRDDRPGLGPKRPGP